MTTQNQTDKYPWLSHIESFEIRGQIVTIANDGPDEDEHPDVNAPIGRVIFEYASEFGFKYTHVEDGRPRSIFLMPETVVAPILSDGTIGSPDMKIEETDGVVRLMPTSVEGLEPSDTTIKATIQLDNYSSKWPPIYFTAQPGDKLNLADLIPEDYFPGVITVVDDSILRQTLYASNQAFDYQEEAKSYAEQAGKSLTTIQNSITNIDSKVSEAQQHAITAETHATEIVGKNAEASRILGESKTILIDTGQLLSNAQTTSRTINEAKQFFDNIYQEHGMLKGDKGDTGVSVTAIVPHFRQRASKPPNPSGTSPSGWSTTEPTYVSGTKLWRSERISYSNNTTAWSTVTEVATYTAIDETKADIADARAAALDYADQKKQEVIDEVDEVKAALEVLKIDGTNLLKNSTNLQFEILDYENHHSYTWAEGFLTDPDILSGTHERQYTLSVDVSSYIRNTGGYMGFWFEFLDGTSSTVTTFGDTAGAWERISTTIHIPKGEPKNRMRINFGDSSRIDRDDYIQYRNWKLERGTKATDWTPSPEDN